MHELAHWLGARIEGVPARITLSRRYYVMVAQTDLSAMWALPRRRRFGPLLAGMAFETVVITILLSARAAQFVGWWHPSTTLARLLAALVLGQVYSISFQFVLFLRTDLYGVLITYLGCLNLSRISRLRMIRLYRRLTAEEEREFAAASLRDKTILVSGCAVLVPVVIPPLPTCVTAEGARAEVRERLQRWRRAQRTRMVDTSWCTVA